MRATGLVATIEAAYRLVDDDAGWLLGVAAAAAPLLDDGLGVVGWMVDPSKPIGEWQSTPVVVGAAPEFCDAVMTTGRRLSAAHCERMYLRGPGIGTISQLLGVPSAGAFDPSRSAANQLGVQDFLGVRAMDPSAGGCFFGAPLRNPGQARRPFIATWSRVGVHVAAGLRLRRALSHGLGRDDAAILDPDGKVQHAEGAARSPRNLDALRSAARRIDRARGEAGRKDPVAVVSDWQALVAGTWSLVDRFESDGRRYLVARENAPDSPDPRALSRQERVVCSYVQSSYSNKMIAYTLGMSEGAASSITARVFRKLGIRSRVELVRRMDEERGRRLSTLQIGSERLCVRSEALANFAGSGLTPAEQQVAAFAVAGRSNAEIASLRKSSERTVANQAASAYRKLGVSSRMELAAKSQGRTPPDGD